MASNASSTNEFAIEARGVSKRFGSVIALDSVDLAVPRGAIFGLLGPNGSGKSTLLGVLLGQIFPDGGEVCIDGHDIHTSRKPALSRVGAVYEAPMFPDYLTGRENLRLLAGYSNRAGANVCREIVERLGLAPFIHRRVATYSHGQRQRLGLAQALLHNPPVLILDEPGDGLDPEGLRELTELIMDLHRERGLTILLSTHHLRDAGSMCSHIAIMRGGHVMWSGPWRPHAGGPRVIIEADPLDGAVDSLLQAGLASAREQGGHIRLMPGVSINDIASHLVRGGFFIRRIAPADKSLEDFYNHPEVS